MMKKWRWILLLVFAFVMGFVFSLLMYQGYWYRFVDGLKTLSWYEYPIWLVLTFMITLTFHELGHLVCMVVQGIKIRALYLYMILIYRTEKGWRIKLKPKLWFLLGGFVVPDLGVIEDDETYKTIVDKFAKSLQAGPRVTIGFLCVSIIAFILAIAFDWNSGFTGILSLLMFYTIILSSLYIKSFKLSNASFYGDFVAYKKMKDDIIFQLVEISQYRSFSLIESKETDLYLFNQIKKIMKNSELKSSLFNQVLIIGYIEGVCYNGYEDDQDIQMKLMRYPLHPHYRSEQGITLLYDIALYYYHLGLVEKSYQLIDEIKKKANQKIDEKMRTYLELKHQHILHIADHSEFLSQKDNFVFRLSGLFEDLVDLSEMTKLMHEKRPFQPWFTEVHLFDEDKQKSDSN